MTHTHHRTRAGLMVVAWVILTALGSFFGAADAQTLTNTATGGNGSTALVDTSATVRLNRASTVAQSVIVEIDPVIVVSGSTGNDFVYDLLPTIDPLDSGISEIRITPPAGYTNVTVTRVEVAGIAQRMPKQRLQRGGGTIVVMLNNRVTQTATPLRVFLRADAPVVAGAGDFTSEVADGTLSMATTPGNADGDPNDGNTISVGVQEPQGIVLDLTKEVERTRVLVGDVVTYRLSIENTTDSDVVDVTLEDVIPSAFDYREGSARLDGAPFADPVGQSELEWDLGTIPARVDVDGNGTVDPGEPGHVVLTYQLIVGSAAQPGTHTNRASARDYCPTCSVSNVATVDVELTLDPDFDLSTLIGKVFNDTDGDGRQDPDEPGVPGAMVVMDDGTYVITDGYGRYHVPAIRPGQRALKLNLSSLPGAATPTTADVQVVWVSPGLIARANFGVQVETEIERTGTDADYGVRIAGRSELLPIHVTGNVGGPDLLVNGLPIGLAATRVHMRTRGSEESVEFTGARLAQPVDFLLKASRSGTTSWRFTVATTDGEIVRTIEGAGDLPSVVPWSGRNDAGRPVPGGRAYQYQLTTVYADGGEATSRWKRFGAHQRTVVSLDLTGEAFESGSALLSRAAQKVLDEAAAVLREHPDERVIVEGHTDSVGSDTANLELSRRRAQAAIDYLVDTHELSADQFVNTAYGETRPIASNDIPEGRALNRRVQLRGQTENVETVYIADQFQTEAAAWINGQGLDLDDYGRFRTNLSSETEAIVVEIRGSDGSTVRQIIDLPEVTFDGLDGERLVAYGDAADGWLVFPMADASPDGGVVEGRVVGRSAPGTEVTIDGETRTVGADSTFVFPFRLGTGREELGVLVGAPGGGTRLINAEIEVADTDRGEPIAVRAATPYLAAALPAEGSVLESASISVSGETSPGNEVHVNGKRVAVADDGRFVAVRDLTPGEAELIVTATDADGQTSELKRTIVVAPKALFLLAFVDAAAGELSASGNIENAGQEEEKEFYTEGRVAFYLKGTVSGKYLITAALDTGSDEFENLFDGLDSDETDRLLTNLDPDKLYPVYGDDSRIVYDAESQGKLYLAVDSETAHLLVGNHALSLSDTELAQYNRTLYGGRFEYRSVARTRYGAPNMEIVLFGSEVEQIHVRDELRATGGSLYYLSHRDVIEGSEQVSVVVRDKNTGLTLSRTEQIQNRDYDVKYDEGRIHFRRPISTVAADGTLVDQELLSGNPVFIHVDYETTTDAFDETVAGARLRRQIGDHVSVGGTIVEDHPDAGPYTLKGVDGEIRIADGTRVVGEYVETEGSDARLFISDDGGLTFTNVTDRSERQGLGWKVAAEADVGEWAGSPGHLWVRGYVKKLTSGFISSGNFLEEGTLKEGARATWKAGRNLLELRVDVEEQLGTGTDNPTNRTASGQWSHLRERWGASIEYLNRRIEPGAGATDIETAFAAARLWATPWERLTTRVDRQQTLDGPDNDQTSVGAELRLHRSLALDAEATDGTLGHSVQGGAILTLGGSRIYLRERLQENRANSETATIMGIDTRVGRGSRVYTEYQWVRSDNEDRAISLLGIQRQWDVSPGLRFALRGERSSVEVDSSDATRTTVGGSVSYLADGIKTHTRHEFRVDSGSLDRVQYVTTNLFDLHVSPDVSLLGRYRYSRTRDRLMDQTEAELEEGSVGVAYRPVTHDRFNGLARYTRLSDKRPIATNPGLSSSRRMDVVSLEGTIGVVPRLELWTKGAARILDDTGDDVVAYRTHTFLGIQRLNLRPWRKLDVGVEYRLLRQREAKDFRSGWLSELSWRLNRNLRFGGGYNFTCFSDDEFKMNDYDVHGWFLRMQGMY